ncbi:MAG: polymerase LigD, ligase domain protein [Verrucomicrobia bacterium]|jgi:bifunctional non-homologous end joining protein LigD|nr:polymerase LigD, ligase domain protein [Verrucomicrobiota bacterium]
MSLKEYTRKRDFSATPEPAAKKESAKSSVHRFVIQKHAASRLHYDFRLELDGTLKSWAVPKGMPFTKGEKRLAVHVEDHPVSYIDFEGTIPQGQYGGGTVMVWDRGTFEPMTKTPLKDLAAGKLHVILKGKKVKGEWYLVRLRDENQWLLIKGGESLKPPSKKQEDTSALSGLSMKELANSKKVWNSKPAASAKDKSKLVTTLKEREDKTAIKRVSSPPKFIEPMKAKLVAAPPAGDWQYEIKFDGFRALAICHGQNVQLISRNEKDLSEKFPEVVKAVKGLKLKDAILDGEVVALDSSGKSSFQLLQAYDLGTERPPIAYYVFDVLRLNREDTRALPLTERRTKLENLKVSGIVRLSPTLGSEGEELLEQARKLGIEGLIGKREGSVYESGQRSGAWIKLKLLQEQEFVIGGFTDPTGSRKHIGALLVGVYEKKQLRYVGKVGTGFDQKLLRLLYQKFTKIAADQCPFFNLPEKSRQRYGQGITASQMKLCHWLKPKFVCQVRFSEWTRDGSLRQPVFLGLREDKDPLEVVREKATS